MNFGGQIAKSKCFRLLDYALERGITFIDTAEAYPVRTSPDIRGQSEKIIGEWLSALRHRKDVTVATKIAGPSLGKLARNQGYTRLCRKQINTAIDNSRRRLRMDVIPIIQIHWPQRTTNLQMYTPQPYTNNVSFDDCISLIIEALMNNVHAGKIQFFGICNETPWGLSEYIKQCETKHCLNHFRGVQNYYCLLNRSVEFGLCEIVSKNNLPFFAYSPLAGGLLTERYAVMKDGQHSSEHTTLLIRLLHELAHTTGVSLQKLAHAFVFSRSWVTSSIIGASDILHIADAVQALDIDWTNELDACAANIFNDAPVVNAAS